MPFMLVFCKIKRLKCFSTHYFVCSNLDIYLFISIFKLKEIKVYIAPFCSDNVGA